MDGQDFTSVPKPEYPVIEKSPIFSKVVGNFNLQDYLSMTTLTAVSIPLGYLSAVKVNLRGPSMVTAGIIGFMGGFMFAYQNSAGRLMGFFPNDEEVACYRKKRVAY